MTPSQITLAALSISAVLRSSPGHPILYRVTLTGDRATDLSDLARICAAIEGVPAGWLVETDLSRYPTVRIIIRPQEKTR